MRELENLIAHGRGRHLKDELHERFGTGLWAYESETCAIQLFESGLFFRNKSSGLVTELAFEAVDNIESCLSVAAISEASRQNAPDMEIPLRIVRRTETITLGVPLVVYSGLLLALQRLVKRHFEDSAKG